MQVLIFVECFVSFEPHQGSTRMKYFTIRLHKKKLISNNILTEWESGDLDCSCSVRPFLGRPLRPFGYLPPLKKLK